LAGLYVLYFLFVVAILGGTAVGLMNLWYYPLILRHLNNKDDRSTSALCIQTVVWYWLSYLRLSTLINTDVEWRLGWQFFSVYATVANSNFDGLEHHKID
jgi:hypothetical protein